MGALRKKEGKTVGTITYRRLVELRDKTNCFFFFGPKASYICRRFKTDAFLVQ